MVRIHSPRPTSSIAPGDSAADGFSAVDDYVDGVDFLARLIWWVTTQKSDFDLVSRRLQQVSASCELPTDQRPSPSGASVSVERTIFGGHLDGDIARRNLLSPRTTAIGAMSTKFAGSGASTSTGVNGPVAGRGHPPDSKS